MSGERMSGEEFERERAHLLAVLERAHKAGAIDAYSTALIGEAERSRAMEAISDAFGGHCPGCTETGHVERWEALAQRNMQLCAERDAARASEAALREENERLRGALGWAEQALDLAKAEGLLGGSEAADAEFETNMRPIRAALSKEPTR